MKLFLYETNIPSWSNPVILAGRIAFWKSSNISTIFLMVDDGKGATWPSTSTPIDPRINLAENPLRVAVELIRNAGIQVILAINIIGIVQGVNPIKQEFILPSGAYYDFWNEAFREWRIAYIKELLSYTGCDAIALDYIRTGQPALPEQIPSDQLVLEFLERLKTEIPSHISILNVSHTVYAKPNSQGVKYLEWYEKGILDSICIYNYSDQFPFRDIEHLPASALWVLRSSYDLVGGVAVSKPALEVEHSARNINRKFGLAGYGLFTANMFSPEQGKVFSHLHLQEKRR